MEPDAAIGISFVLGILGIGTSFVFYYMKSSSRTCERIAQLEIKIEQLYNMVDKLYKDTDKFHPRN